MKRFFGKLGKFIGFFALALLVLAFFLQITGNGYLLNGIRATYLRGENSATIFDLQFFHSRTIPASDKAQALPQHRYYKNEIDNADLKKLLEESRTSAFVLLKNDSILREYYWEGRTKDDISNSFSMAKTVVTLLAQIAIEEGYIDSWDEPVKKWLPELKGAYVEELQLKHLSSMTSGQEWEEDYKHPFSITAKAYYGDDLDKLVLKQAIDEVPGEEFSYKSGTTQLLAIVVSRATQKKLSDYLSEKLWKPLGMERDAEWHLDSEDGSEKAYCCINATARDFARLGMLINAGGKHQNKQLIDSSFIDFATQAHTDENYGMSFWILPEHADKIAYFRGILGQYIIPLPQKNMVIVRLGHQHMEKTDGIHPDDVHQLIEYITTHY